MKCCGFGVAIPQSSIGGNVNAGFNLSLCYFEQNHPALNSSRLNENFYILHLLLRFLFFKLKSNPVFLFVAKLTI